MKAKSIIKVGFVFLLSFVACQPKIPDLKDDIAGWEYLTTFRILPSKTVIVSDKRARIIQGENSVMVVEFETLPIYKPNGREWFDINSKRRLVIELSQLDSFITPAHLGHSKIYREILRMSPHYGINDLKADEEIIINKKTTSQWSVKANLEDFKFEGEFSFADSSVVTNRHKQMIGDQ